MYNNVARTSGNVASSLSLAWVGCATSALWQDGIYFCISLTKPSSEREHQNQDKWQKADKRHEERFQKNASVKPAAHAPKRLPARAKAPSPAREKPKAAGNNFEFKSNISRGEQLAAGNGSAADKSSVSSGKQLAAGNASRSDGTTASVDGQPIAKKSRTMTFGATGMLKHPLPNDVAAKFDDIALVPHAESLEWLVPAQNATPFWTSAHSELDAQTGYKRVDKSNARACVFVF